MDRIVIVTGGSEGIGYACAERFLRDGDTVVITSRREAEGKAAEAKLSQYGKAVWMACDIAKEDDCIKVVDEVVKNYKRIDVLVNNAGTTGARGEVLDQDMENIRNVLAINVMGTIQMIKYCGRVMKENGKGVIVNIGSLCGAIANPESVAYHASKGAIRMITQCTARELTPYGIRVVSVAPGWVGTPLLHKMMLDNGPAAAAHGASLHMRNQVIEPSEIAGAVYLLSSDEAMAINGTTIMADDGYSSFKA